MSNFMEVCSFWISLNRAELGCWPLTLNNEIYFTELAEVLQKL